MPIIYGGAGVVGADDVYVVIKPPTGSTTSGGSSLQGAIVGGAQWGAKNSPYFNSTPGDLLRNHGLPLLSNPAPMVQEAALFLKQLPVGGVITSRVTDGTDIAASGSINDTSGTPKPKITATGIYTGSLGNTLSLVIAAGTLPNTLKAIVYSGNNPGEVYDRIPATGSVAALVNSINNGTVNNPPSGFIVVSAGTSTVELAIGDSVNLTGGLDGVTGITKAQLLGVDGTQGTRTGMYSLRKQKMDIVWLAGCTDSTTWSTLSAFAQSETAMGIGNFPNGTAVAGALTSMASSGAANPYLSVMLGHAVYYDSYLQQNIYVPSAGVLAGVCCSLAPHISPGNKLVAGILGTDHTFGPTASPFSDADEAQLEAAGINFISLGIPQAPNSLGIRHGKNTSPQPSTNEVAYTRKTNDIARALAGPVLGQFVNQPQSTAPNDPLREAIRNSLNGYFAPQVGTEIDDYVAQCDLSNNPVPQIQKGIVQADVTCEYLANTNKFIINLTGGQTVTVQVNSLNAATV